MFINMIEHVRCSKFEGHANRNVALRKDKSKLSSHDNNLNHNQPLLTIKNKNTGIEITLSVQKSRCMQELLKGKTAKEIARCLNLSPRTVEHYLEDVRSKVGCRSARELLTLYYSKA